MAARSSTARRSASEDNDDATSMTETLKTFGVDTDVMAEAAKEKASDLQALIADELKNRPLRTLGVAAAIGALFGVMASR